MPGPVSEEYQGPPSPGDAECDRCWLDFPIGEMVWIVGLRLCTDCAASVIPPPDRKM